MRPEEFTLSLKRGKVLKQVVWKDTALGCRGSFRKSCWKFIVDDTRLDSWGKTQRLRRTVVFVRVCTFPKSTVLPSPGVRGNETRRPVPPTSHWYVSLLSFESRRKVGGGVSTLLPCPGVLTSLGSTGAFSPRDREPPLSTSNRMGGKVGVVLKDLWTDHV